MHPDNAQKAFEHIDKLLNKQANGNEHQEKTKRRTRKPKSGIMLKFAIN